MKLSIRNMTHEAYEAWSMRSIKFKHPLYSRQKVYYIMKPRQDKEKVSARQAAILASSYRAPHCIALDSGCEHEVRWVWGQHRRTRA